MTLIVFDDLIKKFFEFMILTKQISVAMLAWSQIFCRKFENVTVRIRISKYFLFQKVKEYFSLQWFNWTDKLVKHFSVLLTCTGTTHYFVAKCVTSFWNLLKTLEIFLNLRYNPLSIKLMINLGPSTILIWVSYNILK